MEREWVFKNRTEDIIGEDTSENDRFDDDIIANNIVDDLREELIDKGVNSVEDDSAVEENNRDIERVRNKILTDAASRHTEQGVPTRETIPEEGVYYDTAELPEYKVTPQLTVEALSPTYAEMVRPPSPKMERQKPGNIRTEARQPRIKIESDDAVYTNNVPQSPARQNIVVDINDDDSTESILDAREIYIDDVDEYHPDSLTPSHRNLLRSRTPIRARCRSKSTVDDVALIHCALTQLTLK